MRSLRRRLVLGPVFLLTTWAAGAHAFERQWHLGGGLGAAAFSQPNGSGVGPTAELALTYGLNDEFNLLAEVSTATFGATLSPTADQAAWFSGSVGAAYTLDVLRWVPYVGVLAGATRVGEGRSWGGAFAGDARHHAYFDLVAAGGLDYQITRDLSVGGALRFHTLVAASPSYAFAGTLRAQYTWGFLRTANAQGPN